MTNAPAVSALGTYLVIFLLDLFRGVDALSSWTPVGLVRPDSLLEGGSASEYVRAGVIALGVLLLSAWLTLSRALRSIPRDRGRGGRASLKASG